jgi:hypothetical protein
MVEIVSRQVRGIAVQEIEKVVLGISKLSLFRGYSF